MRTRGLSEVKKRLGDITEVLARYTEPPQVLEVGCGYGYAMRDLAQQCPRARIRGMNLVPYPEQLPDQSYLYGDASEGIPLPDNSMDFIYSIVTIYFMKNRARFLEEVYRVLKPGGQFRCNFMPIVEELSAEYENTDVVEGLDGIETLHDLLLSLPNHDVKSIEAELQPATIMNKHPGEPPLKLGLVLVPEKQLDYGEVAGDRAEGFLRNWYRFSPADCTVLSTS